MSTTNHTDRDPLVRLKSDRDEALAKLDEQREDIQREYVTNLRAAIESDPEETLVSAARKLAVSRDSLYQLFRKYIPAG